MTVTFGRNISALRSLRLLDRTSSDVSTALQRLSSGQRINRASDDSAGLAVSSALGAKATILRRARLNLSDAISAANVADATLGQLSGVLTRMAELAEQAANGSLGDSQRARLNDEFRQLEHEIRRITRGTTFGGRELLEGKQAARAGKTVFSSILAPISAVSPDGRYLLTNGALAGGIYLVDGETSISRLLSAPGYNGGVTVAGITNSGDVYFSQALAGAGSGEDIFVYSSASATYTKLTNQASSGAEIGAISMSLDGSTLAFTTEGVYTDGGSMGQIAGTGDYRMAVVDLATGTVRTNSKTVITGQIALSADGSKVALITASDVSYGANAGQAYLFDYTAQTPSFLRLTQNFAQTYSLVGITDDGDAYLVGSQDIFRGRAESSEVKVWDNPGGNLTGLTMNADGTSFFFISDVDRTGDNPSGFDQAFHLDLLHGGLHQLTRFTYDIKSPNTAAMNWFSKDGSYLYTVESGSMFNETAKRFDIRPENLVLDFEAGSGAAGRVTVDLAGALWAIQGLGASSLTSAMGARHALDKATRSLELLAGARGLLGAGLSRLASAHGMAQRQGEEALAARSRISDMDVAAETAALTRSSIMQSISAALLAQASQQPALALSLLSTESPGIGNGGLRSAR